VLRAKTLAGFSAVDGQGGNWAGGTLLPGVRPQFKPSELKFFALFSGRPVTPDAQRLPFEDLTVPPSVNLGHYGDQMTQHPPLYYAVSAGVVLGLGAMHWHFDRTLALMRLVSVAMVGLLPLMAFSVTRRLTGSRWLADVAAVLPLGIPQLTSIGGSVTNDALVIFFGGLSAVLLAKVLCGDRSWRTLLLIAGTLGLALLTKGTLLVLVPVTALALVVGARRSANGPPLSLRSTLGRLAAVEGIAFVIGGWWWALNLVRYGMIQPQGLPGATDPARGVGRVKLSVFGYFGRWWQDLATSFWGKFGWLEFSLNQAVVLALTAALTVAVLLAFRRRGVRVLLLVLLSAFALTAGLLFDTTYTSHAATGGFGGIQGRYLFGALVPVFAAAAIGVGSLVPRRFERWLPAIALPAVLASAAYGLWVAFLGFYRDVGWSLGSAWARMVAWSPFPGWAAVGLLIALVLLSLVAFGLAVWTALRAPRDDVAAPTRPIPLAETPVPAS
jgi:4-amino-4-deoxy-L-arabinose transferase-like glycosyltransferase